jgi:CO dehydrogenase maturation factor
VRIAVAGKGGAGKTTLSATLARLAARGATAVVAVDADANPNLAPALGVPLEVAAGLRPVSPALVSRRRGGPGLVEPIEEVLDRHAIPAPDGVRLMGMGAPAHAEEGCLCSAHAVVAGLLEDLGGADRTVVVDMEASPEHLSRGTVRHVDAVCLVAEPYYRSLETVRRMAALVAELPVSRTVVVANKIRSAGDEAAVAEFCARHELTLCGTVPWCDAVTAADRVGRPVVDWPAARPVVAAVELLADRLGVPTQSRSTGSRPEQVVAPSV